MATRALDVRTNEPVYREAERQLAGITTPVEKRVLAWLAARLPRRVSPDHLTTLGLGAMLLAGVAYAGSGRAPWLLWIADIALVLNWFGDSLDGTVARYRGQSRPRYGFYIDHICDVFGAIFLLTGLWLSGHMAPAIALALLIAYLLFSVNLYLATHTLGRFRMSYGAIGGTELRILLVGVNLLALVLPNVAAFGLVVGVFDLVGILATAGLLVTVVASISETAAELSDLERV